MSESFVALLRTSGRRTYFCVEVTIPRNIVHILKLKPGEYARFTVEKV